MFKPPATSRRSAFRVSDCVFGCPPQGGPTQRFPHPIKYPKQFADWIEAICDSVEPEDPLITELINSDPQYIFVTKCICESHFTTKNAPSNNKSLDNTISVRNLKVLKKTNVRYRLEQKRDAPEMKTHKDRTELHMPSVIPGVTKAGDLKVESWNETDVSMYDELNDNIRESTNRNNIKLENIDEPSLVEQDVEAMHEDFTCNGCRGYIVGFRYACVQCADFDLCAACESRGAHLEHYMLRVPGPRPYAEVKSMLEIIRQKLALYNFETPQENVADRLDDIKVEPNDDEDLTPHGIFPEVPLTFTNISFSDQTNTATLPARNCNKTTTLANTKQNEKQTDSTNVPVFGSLLKAQHNEAKENMLSSLKEKENKMRGFKVVPNMDTKQQRKNTSIRIVSKMDTLVRPILTTSTVSTFGATTVYLVKRPSLINKMMAKKKLLADPLKTDSANYLKLKQARVVVQRLSSQEIQDALSIPQVT